MSDSQLIEFLNTQVTAQRILLEQFQNPQSDAIEAAREIENEKLMDALRVAECCLIEFERFRGCDDVIDAALDVLKSELTSVLEK